MKSAKQLFDRGQEIAAELDAAFCGFLSVDALLDAMAGQLDAVAPPKARYPEPGTGRWLQQPMQWQQAGNRALALAAEQAARAELAAMAEQEAQRSDFARRNRYVIILPGGTVPPYTYGTLAAATKAITSRGMIGKAAIGRENDLPICK